MKPEIETAHAAAYFSKHFAQKLALERKAELSALPDNEPIVILLNDAFVLINQAIKSGKMDTGMFFHPATEHMLIDELCDNLTLLGYKVTPYSNKITGIIECFTIDWSNQA